MKRTRSELTKKCERLYRQVFATTRLPWPSLMRIRSETKEKLHVPTEAFVEALILMKRKRIGASYPALQSIAREKAITMAESARPEGAPLPGEPEHHECLSVMLPLLMGQDSTPDERIRAVMLAMLDLFGDAKVKEVLSDMSRERREASLARGTAA